jgi:hypothetical protein
MFNICCLHTLLVANSLWPKVLHCTEQCPIFQHTTAPPLHCVPYLSCPSGTTYSPRCPVTTFPVCASMSWSLPHAMGYPMSPAQSGRAQQRCTTSCHQSPSLPKQVNNQPLPRPSWLLTTSPPALHEICVGCPRVQLLSSHPGNVSAGMQVCEAQGFVYAWHAWKASVALGKEGPVMHGLMLVWHGTA